MNPELPAELERTVAKCLEKDRELRYQHASDIRADLKRLKRDTESGRSGAAGAASAEQAATPAPSSGIVSATETGSKPPSTGSAVAAAARQHKWAVLGGAILGAAGWRVYSLLTRTKPAPFQNFTISQVTQLGDVIAAADWHLTGWQATR